MGTAASRVGPLSVKSWQMRSQGEPLSLGEWTVGEVPSGQVLVRVAGCGVCHTDLGYFYDGVRTRHALPLTLGHEIAGTVEEAGAGAEAWVGRAVVVPAVMPCGECEVCRAGRGSICPKQIFPGNDVHGGFGSHVVVPAKGLCAVDDAALAKSGLELADLSVLADAITTPYQALARAKPAPRDLTVFIGVGGVGGFGVQIARAMGAHVVALDIDDERLARLRPLGAAHVLNVKGKDAKEIRAALRAYAKEHDLYDNRWKIFETSGTAAGQSLAFALLNHGAVLSVVGYTMESISVRLSNLMAFDAVAQGTWGCLPELYPAALRMVLDGEVKVAPLVERRPMSKIRETFEDLRAKRLTRRPVLIPDFR